MKTSDFNFELPKELIAQTPIENREGSRLLCLNRKTGKIQHSYFTELIDLLEEGDCLVFNDSRVMPARLLGKRETGGAVEVLLLSEREDNVWECLTRPGAKTKPGTRLIFGEGELTGIITGITEDGNRLIDFYNSEFGIRNSEFYKTTQQNRPPVLQLLNKLGKMPLPPYIHEELNDPERYQTVYARETGSAAAPTAGLHFTEKILEDMKAKGIKLAFMTLHVGLGTFRPVKADDIEDHKMHSEYFIIPPEAAETINNTKAEGKRVIAVGTTSCRALEAIADENGKIKTYSGYTDIFIYPGYEFKCINGLITNFHLPESTLIMLVSAFAGREYVLNAYKEAVRERYRFFSFGDAMLLV